MGNLCDKSRKNFVCFKANIYILPHGLCSLAFSNCSWDMLYTGFFCVGTLQKLLALQKCKQRPSISKYWSMWVACSVCRSCSITLQVYNNVTSNVTVNKDLWINAIKLQRKKEDAFEEIRLHLSLSEISLSWTLYVLILLKRNNVEHFAVPVVE